MKKNDIAVPFNCSSLEKCKIDYDETDIIKGQGKTDLNGSVKQNYKQKLQNVKKCFADVKHVIIISKWLLQRYFLNLNK